MMAVYSSRGRAKQEAGREVCMHVGTPDKLREKISVVVFTGNRADE